MAPDYVLYRPDVETTPPEEAETIGKILESMHRLMGRTREQRCGHAIRVSHAKAHGAAVGELEVFDGLADTKVDTQDPDGLRTATVGHMRGRDAEFDVRVRLCTDLDKMPVANANKEWSEHDSPYIAVARVRLPRQEAYSEARIAYVNDALSFCISHSLEAHRPLGSIQRARLAAYPHMTRLRREANGRSLAEPRSVEEVPA